MDPMFGSFMDGLSPSNQHDPVARILGDYLSEQGVPYAWLLSAGVYPVEFDRQRHGISVILPDRYVRSLVGNGQFLAMAQRPARVDGTARSRSAHLVRVLPAFSDRPWKLRFSVGVNAELYQRRGQLVVACGGGRLDSYDVSRQALTATAVVRGMTSGVMLDNFLAQGMQQVWLLHPETLQTLSEYRASDFRSLGQRPVLPGQDLLQVSYSGHIELVDMLTQRVYPSPPVPGALSPDRSLMARVRDVGRGDGWEVVVSEVHSGKVHGTLWLSGGTEVRDLQFSPDGQQLLAAVCQGVADCDLLMWMPVDNLRWVAWQQMPTPTPACEASRVWLRQGQLVAQRDGGHVVVSAPPIRRPGVRIQQANERPVRVTVGPDASLDAFAVLHEGPPLVLAVRGVQGQQPRVVFINV